VPASLSVLNPAPCILPLKVQEKSQVLTAFRAPKVKLPTEGGQYVVGVKDIQRRTKIRKVTATNVKEFLPTILRTLFTLLKEKKEGHKITLKSGDYLLADMCSKHRHSSADRSD